MYGGAASVSAPPVGAPAQSGGLTPAQRQKLAEMLKGGGNPRMSVPMLNLGNVQGSLPGGGVTSPNGVVGG